MVAAAKALGLEYIAITDHTRGLAMTGGSDEARLREQAAAIGALNRRLPRLPRALAGAEVNIDQDGTLDIDDETLAELDVVGVAVHSTSTCRAPSRRARVDPRHGEPARRHPLPPDRPRARQARADRASTSTP